MIAWRRLVARLTPTARLVVPRADLPRGARCTLCGEAVEVPPVLPLRYWLVCETCDGLSSW